jgi:hypothetical protein
MGLTMAENANINEPLVDVVVNDPIPAPGADDQKPIPTEGEAPPEAVTETTEQQEAKKQSKFQRRLDRQKAGRVAAETEARLLREQLAKLEAQKQTQPQESGEPKRDDFPDYEAYLRAVTKWEVGQETDKRLKAEREERQKQERGREQQGRSAVEQEKIAKGWAERETAFQKAQKDYLEVVTPYVEEDLGHLSDAARRAIVESEFGPQVLHHLATNPEVAEAIAELSPYRQVAELGKLEVNMKPVAKKASNAPAPITPVKAGRSASPGLSENDSQAEYEAKRKAQQARWAR